MILKGTYPRIGIFSDQRFPCNDTDTQQIMKNASALARIGLPVELIIPIRSGRLLWSREERIREVVDFYNIPPGLPISHLPTVPAGEFRPPTKLAYWMVAPWYLLLRRFDVAYTRSPLPALICLSTGKNVVYETYRRWGDESPFITSLFARFSRSPNFLGVITHSGQSARSLLKAGFPEDRVVAMHNGYDLGDMEPMLTRDQARVKLGLDPGKPLVVYTGNMQESKCIESIIDLAALAPEVDFLLVGGIAQHVDRLTRYADRAHARNVKLERHQPPGEIPPYLYAADVLIIPPTEKPLYTYGTTVLPFKLFTYLAAGRPILAPALPDMGELLTHDGNACLVTPDRPEESASELRSLLGDAARQEKIARAARKTVKELTWDKRAQRIRDWLLSRIG